MADMKFKVTYSQEGASYVIVGLRATDGEVAAARAVRIWNSEEDANLPPVPNGAVVQVTNERRKRDVRRYQVRICGESYTAFLESCNNKFDNTEPRFEGPGT